MLVMVSSMIIASSIGMIVLSVLSGFCFIVVVVVNLFCMVVGVVSFMLGVVIVTYGPQSGSMPGAQSGSQIPSFRGMQVPSGFPSGQSCGQIAADSWLSHTSSESQVSIDVE